jgi:hypothetical protein
VKNSDKIDKNKLVALRQPQGYVEAVLLHHTIKLSLWNILWHTGSYVKMFAQQSAERWHNAYYNKTFKRTLFFGIVLLPLVLMCTYQFFNYIQDCRGGIVLNDWVLKSIPARDVSIPISIIMASVIGLCVLRCLANPSMFIIVLIALILLFATRIVTISITRLMAPVGLIELKDPICNLMYGSRFITKDLFYSGHTATLSLLYFCAYKKIDKYCILFAVILVGALLLIQHVHYTVDVACAPLFAFGCFWLSKKIIKHQHIYKRTVPVLNK